MYVLYWVAVLICDSYWPLWFCNHLAEKQRVCCFTLIVFLLLCSCLRCVSLSHGTKGWSVVYDWDISGSLLSGCFFVLNQYVSSTRLI